ncbi:type-F conjugative transfer system protein TraW (plasmid) [Bermanella marisrubri]|uniref:TraW n=1 Tax=Bermanella marisrubri TaxID=207949 RepID=Q1MY36_9GAMM|nr:hypothetical protein [Bermanella marisrubri]EAT10860.1 TraW [Oceanobacter sp. RED65] [Bermanella marisrubri]QIZ85913.1 type-F conjugative transfer system protein TraW [Bermanella marisrubri]
MKVILSVLLAVFTSFVLGDELNLGALGKSYPVIERSPLDEILNNAKNLVENGGWKEIQEKKKEAVKSFLERPPGIKLPTTDEYRRREWDATYIVKNDIYTAEGVLIAKSGQKINPLDFKRMTKQYCFFNMDDKMQRAWIEQNCANPIKSKAIGVFGSVKDFAESTKLRVFFDQYGKLVDRFDIRHVPAIVRQIGNKIYVEEYPIN